MGTSIHKGVLFCVCEPQLKHGMNSPLLERVDFIVFDFRGDKRKPFQYAPDRQSR